MLNMYITQQDMKVCIDDGKFRFKADKEERTIPSELIDSFTIYGNVQFSSGALRHCLSKGIPVCFLSSFGKVYGSLAPAEASYSERIIKQVHFSEDEARTLEFSKRIISAKIRNQRTVLDRYSKGKNEVSDRLKLYSEKIWQCDSVAEIMGFEGSAARLYFEALGKIVRPDFAFSTRTRRPPKDPFNALISFGYTRLSYEIESRLVAYGLNTGIGFMHKERGNTPALVCDLMEEWRAPVVDSIALSLIQGNEVKAGDFYKTDNGGIYLGKEIIKKFSAKYEQKMASPLSYIIGEDITYRECIGRQISLIAHCIDKGDASDYSPIRIR